MSSVEEPQDLHEYIASALDRIGGSEDLSELTALNDAGTARGKAPAPSAEERVESGSEANAAKGTGGKSGPGEEGGGDGASPAAAQEGEEGASPGRRSSLLADLMSSCLTTLLVIKVSSLARPHLLFDAR